MNVTRDWTNSQSREFPYLKRTLIMLKAISAKKMNWAGQNLAKTEKFVESTFLKATLITSFLIWLLECANQKKNLPVVNFLVKRQQASRFLFLWFYKWLNSQAISVVEFQAKSQTWNSKYCQKLLHPTLPLRWPKRHIFLGARAVRREGAPLLVALAQVFAPEKWAFMAV